MAFEALKGLFSGGSSNQNRGITDAEVERLVDAFLSHPDRNIPFRMVAEIDNNRIYASQLSVILKNKNISSDYLLIMKSLDVYIVKAVMDKGKPLIKLPKSFELSKDTVSIYDFTRYDLDVSFIEYKGFYKEE